MSDYFIGEFRVFPYNRIPTGWLPCDGRTMQITGNAALFSLLGTFYGGDGKTTFMLPDFRGRTPVAFGQGQGLAYPIGHQDGAETVTLTMAQIPAHSHQVAVVSDQVSNQNFISGNLLAQVGSITDMSPQVYYGPATANLVTVAAQTVGSTGGNAAHPNMQPFLALNICISTTGLYPQRP